LTQTRDPQVPDHDVALVRHGYELWNSGDIQGLADACFSDTIEWYNPPEWPGQHSYFGAGAVVRFLREEVAETIELGDIHLEGIDVFGSELLIRLMAHTRGHDSNLDLGKIPVYHVAQMRDGRVARVRAFLDERQALQAASGVD
jgi:ketosteroid isomerase-like protein